MERKASIVTVEGFTKSYVPIKEAIDNLGYQNGGKAL